MKSLRLVVVGVGALAFLGLVVVQFGNFEARTLRNKVAALEKEKTQLVDYANRLSASRRVAQVTVIDQRADEAGRMLTSLMWQELGPGGTVGSPQSIEVQGTTVYFEAFVLKFAHQRIAQGDPDTSSSLALFRRVFGDRQAPETAPQFDRSARPPIDISPQTQQLHARLWGRFWEMVDNPKVADEFGVRIAQCEAVAAILKKGQIWEVALDAAGGLNLKRIGNTDAIVQSMPSSD